MSDAEKRMHDVLERHGFMAVESFLVERGWVRCGAAYGIYQEENTVPTFALVVWWGDDAHDSQDDNAEGWTPMTSTGADLGALYSNLRRLALEVSPC